jgi:Tol biopolymer transport system component
MKQQTQKTLCIIILLLLALLIAACNGESTYPSGLIPTPRDVTSPSELSPELANLRIAWSTEQPEERSITLVNLDSSDQQPILLPEYAVSPDISPTTHYVVYTTSLLLEGNIEMLDLQTKEHRILVNGKESFPGVSLLNPSFSPDEEQVVFEVTTSNRIDLAIVELASGKVQYLDLGGGFNMWPEVSPDGKWILVACEHPTQGGFSLCLLDRDQRVSNYLVDDQVSVNGEFTPDSQHVVYVGVIRGSLSQGELYQVGIDGKNKRLLVSGLHPGANVIGVTTHDVVFTCSNSEQPACRWVCVVGLDGSDVRRLTYLGKHCIDVDAP